MADIITLRGAVLSKYRTISEFSEDIGWKRNKSSRILNGVQSPNADEIEEIPKCLGINTVEDFMQIFFAPLVHKMDSESETTKIRA